MRKIKIILILFILIISLSGCFEIERKDAQLAFVDHVTESESFYLEYQEILNYIQDTYVPSNLKIINHIEGQSTSTTGSGFVFHEDENNYYILSNEHVTVNNTNKEQIITLIDHQGNEYGGSVLFADKEYDLSVIRFTKGSKTFLPIKMANTNANKGDNIYIISTPKHQVNNVTFGRIIMFSIISVEEGYINFEVIVSSAPVQHGSSGGMMLNNNGELIGVVYAGNVLSNEFSSQSFAVPISKVFEFLSLNDFSLGGN